MFHQFKDEFYLSWYPIVVLASCGCCNKLPQTGWLNTTDVYSLPVLEARSLKLKCQQSWFLLEALREPVSLPASSGCPQFLSFPTCEGISPISASFFSCPPASAVCLCGFSFSDSYKDTHPWVQGPPWSRMISSWDPYLSYTGKDPYSKGHIHRFWVHTCLGGHSSATAAVMVSFPWKTPRFIIVATSLIFFSFCFVSLSAPSPVTHIQHGSVTRLLLPHYSVGQTAARYRHL